MRNKRLVSGALLAALCAAGLMSLQASELDALRGMAERGPAVQAAAFTGDRASGSAAAVGATGSGASRPANSALKPGGASDTAKDGVGPAGAIRAGALEPPESLGEATRWLEAAAAQPGQIAGYGMDGRAPGRGQVSPVAGWGESGLRQNESPLRAARRAESPGRNAARAERASRGSQDPLDPGLRALDGIIGALLILPVCLAPNPLTAFLAVMGLAGLCLAFGAKPESGSSNRGGVR